MQIPRLTHSTLPPPIPLSLITHNGPLNAQKISETKKDNGRLNSSGDDNFRLQTQDELLTRSSKPERQWRLHRVRELEGRRRKNISLENRFSSRVASSIIGHCTQSLRSPAPNLNSWCPSSETSRSSSSYSVFSVLQVMRPMSKLSSFNYLDPGEEHLRPFSFARTQNHQPFRPPPSFFSFWFRFSIAVLLLLWLLPSMSTRCLTLTD